VAVDVARQIVAVLRGEPAPYAVNAPLVAPETLAVVAPYLEAAELTGLLATQLAEGQMREIRLRYSGEIGQHDTTVLKAAAIRGLLRPISEENVTVVNAELVASGRGLRIIEIKGPTDDTYSNLVTVEVETSAGVTTVSGTVEHGRPHIVEINGLWVDVTPAEEYLLICDNLDRPGMIGAVGMLMSKHDINISSMKVGRREQRGRAVMVLGLDEPVTDEQIQELLAIPDIYGAKLVRLDFR
jgi:D-3-phosphoglycerate dehydrogenase